MIDEEMLDMINEGRVTISINGTPLVSLDSDSKSFEVEISGLKQNDLKLSNLFEAKKKKDRMFLKTSHVVRKLTKKGWSFSLYDKGDQILTAGYSASKLGSSLRLNPLRLKRILDVL